MRSLLLLLFVLGFAQAQTSETFWDALQEHPAVKAQAALVVAAQARLEAVYAPVSLNASGNYTRLNLDLPELPPGQELPDIPSNLVGFSLGASFRPFVLGDLGDLAVQRRIDLERAQLSYLETLSSVEVQALEAASTVELSRAASDAATAGRDLAERVLSVTRTRATRGAASTAELRTAEARLREAENALRSAEANLSLAEGRLANLIGEASAPPLPRLAPVTGTLPSIRRAQLDLQLAQVGVANSRRTLYPTAQASYTWPLSDEKSELSVSVESRTLQPSLAYSYQNPKQGAAGFSAPDGVPASALKGSFTLGVAMEFSPEAYGALEAANAQLLAADASLQAALDSADLTALSLESSQLAAQRDLAFSQESVANTELDLEEVRQRQELGLATELEIVQAEFARTQAEVALRSAEQTLFLALLDSYRSYAVPPSSLEARP